MMHRLAGVLRNVAGWLRRLTSIRTHVRLANGRAAFADSVVSAIFAELSPPRSDAPMIAIYRAGARLGGFAAAGLWQRDEAREALIDAVRATRLDDVGGWWIVAVERGFVHGATDVGRVCAARSVLRRLGSLDDSAPATITGAVAAASGPLPAPPADGEERVWRQAWEDAGPLTGTPAERYLCEARRVIARERLADLDPALRWHHAPPLTADGRCRAAHGGLVALVTDAAGEPIGLQTTPLLAGGRDRVSGKSQRSLGRTRGGAVRLLPMRACDVLGAGVAVAEDIESALGFTSLSNYGVPCWAVLDATNLAAWTPPTAAIEVVIAADHHEAGLASANELALVLRDALGLAVEVWRPAPIGWTWADVALERATARDSAAGRS